ncbi:MAG: Gfo/Idh/MocA family oxidoreductase [Desulfobacterales bacterium]
MEKLKVGVIGTGYLGKFHAEKYADMEDVELVGVVDTNQKQAREVAERLKVAAYFRPEDILGKVDAVSIVVPTLLHHEVSGLFLRHDVDVLIEKPITTTLKEADALIELAESRGLIIQVGHLERFNPAVIALEDVLETPMFIESHRLSIFQPRGTDVDVVLDLMIHDIDIILNLVQSEITGIQAAGIPVITGHGDIANARLEFASGCVANVTASRISLKNERKLRLFQRDAYIAVDFANREITVIRRNGNQADSVIPGTDINRRCFTKSDALKAELASFVQSVKNRIAPEVTGSMGRDALKVALNIMEQTEKTRRKFLGS